MQPVSLDCLPSLSALPAMQALTVALCCCRVLAQLPLLSAPHLGRTPPPTARAVECPPHERPLLRSLAHLFVDQLASLDAIMHATEVAMPPVCVHGKAHVCLIRYAGGEGVQLGPAPLGAASS
jgi:hypothetical protein